MLLALSLRQHNVCNYTNHSASPGFPLNRNAPFDLNILSCCHLCLSKPAEGCSILCHFTSDPNGWLSK